jgi:hypothetical protein
VQEGTVDAVDGVDVSLKLDAAFIPVTHEETEVDYEAVDPFNLFNQRKQKLYGMDKFAIDSEDQDVSTITVDIRECSGMKIV